MFNTNLPVVVLKNTILFPQNEIRLEIETEKEKALLSLAEAYYNKHVLVVNNSSILDTDYDLNSLSKIGVVGYISMKLELPNNKTRVVIKGVSRVNIDNYTTDEEAFILGELTQVKIERLDEIEEIAYSRSLIKQVEYYIDNNPNISNSILSQIKGQVGIDKLTDIICPAIIENRDRKLEYVKEVNPTIRVTMLLEDVNQEMKIVELESSIEDKISKNIDLSQKDFILQEKLKVIKNELGITFDKDEDFICLKKQIDNLRSSKRIKDILYKELNRYESTPVTSPEISIIRGYIELMLSLPWQKTTIDNKNLNRAKEYLNKTHYGLEDVKTRIIEFLALRQMTNNNNSPIICLVGPPGVGKTSLVRSIAEAINRNYVKISVGGINDEAEIIGHRRTYIGAAPGRIIQGLKKCGSNNPVFVIDEIDKMCKDIKGDPASALLEVLDKEQNSSFCDNYVEEAFDLSKVMFICTANYIDDIPLELKDRLEIIEINSYTEYEKLNICKDYIIPKSLKNSGLKKDQVKFTDSAILKIIRNYTKESGVRELERIINTILRKIVTSIIIDNNNKDYILTETNIKTYLKSEKYELNLYKYSNRIGIVNAMSYTLFGGDIFPIEVNFYPGNGNLITTGSLGNEFNEIAKVAISYIKSNYKLYGLSLEQLTSNDIHIHVPFESIKKEGPSAGIAITLAIISAFLNKEIPEDISFTGEITLRGNILPVGGLKEKIIGAKRNNIKKIIIPKENKKDIVMIDNKLKENVKIIYVSDFEEVVKELNI